MTEPSPIEIQYSKTQTPSQDTQKRKKSSKKKADPKPTNSRTETLEDLKTEADFDLIHHTYRLEQQLASVKRQLKQQKQKFRQVIHGLANYFDEKGVSSQAVEEYIKNLGTQITDNQDLESDYEKFFTVHKYQIVEDPNTFGTKSLPRSGQKAENGPKNTPKPPSNSVKPDTNEVTHIDLTSDKGDKPEKKKSKSSAKTADGNGTEEAPKKRKYTKHKQTEEGLSNVVSVVPDIQEIPPLLMKDFPKKPENKVKKAEDVLRSYEEISQRPMDLGMLGQSGYGLDDGLKAMVKQMNIDPEILMNSYMAGNFGMPEGDMYQKIYQELMKGSTPNPMLNTDKARQELFNYYQGNFK